MSRIWRGMAHQWSIIPRNGHQLAGMTRETGIPHRKLLPVNEVGTGVG